VPTASKHPGLTGLSCAQKSFPELTGEQAGYETGLKSCNPVKTKGKAGIPASARIENQPQTGWLKAVIGQ
jgi:hypothetical protein